MRERLGPISARARLGPVRGSSWRGSRPFIMRSRFSSFRGRGGAGAYYGGYPANSQYPYSRGTFRGRPSRGYRGRGGNQYGTGKYISRPSFYIKLKLLALFLQLCDELRYCYVTVVSTCAFSIHERLEVCQF